MLFGYTSVANSENVRTSVLTNDTTSCQVCLQVRPQASPQVPTPRRAAASPDQGHVCALLLPHPYPGQQSSHIQPRSQAVSHAAQEAAFSLVPWHMGEHLTSNPLNLKSLSRSPSGPLPPSREHPSASCPCALIPCLTPAPRCRMRLSSRVQHCQEG